MQKQKRYDSSDLDRLTKIDKTLYISLITAATAASICIATLTDCTPRPAQGAYKSHYTKTEFIFQDFFRKHKSPVPVEMAIAVSKTKRPALMAALSIVESNGDPSAIGDSGLSKGAFQVQERHWGSVPSNASEQAIQAERILEELERSNRRGKLRHTLARYNGGNRPPRVSYKYADSIMALQRRLNK